MTPPGFEPPTWQAREAAVLAPWAMPAADSAGRVHPEQPHLFRSPYQRDRDRIVHSAAFRRLAHKTQVFTGYHGDYHRSRLTHTLEVTNIARTLARALALNEDLVETLALAHDIGHPPLGHAGEDVLAELLRDDGGFNHNAQALRIMELLETRYPEFPGLNLSREVLDAQATRKKDGAAPAPLLETQVVDAADSIAYDTHDVDDAIELGLVSLDELLELPRAAFRPAAGGTRRLVTHAPDLAAAKRELERFLFEKVYRSERVLAIRVPAQRKLADLFGWYLAHPDELPPGFRERAKSCGIPRSTADYIAGMTDRFLEADHARRLS